MKTTAPTLWWVYWNHLYPLHHTDMKQRFPTVHLMCHILLHLLCFIIIHGYKNTQYQTISHKHIVILGRIYLQKSNKDCSFCFKYFFTDRVADCHAFISLKDVSDHSLIYSSEEFINVVHCNKRIIFVNFVNVFEKANLLCLLKEKLCVPIYCCEEHDASNNQAIAQCIVSIMFKYILYQINRKLHLEDLRENNVIDNFLKIYGPKLLSKK